MRNKIFYIPLIIVSLFILTGCDEENRRGGTSDGGGGIVVGSTQEQVERAIGQARTFLLDPRFRYYLSVAVRTHLAQVNSPYDLLVGDCKELDIYCVTAERMEYYNLLAEKRENDGEIHDAWRELNELSGIEFTGFSESSQASHQLLVDMNITLSHGEMSWAINRSLFRTYVENIPLDLVKSDSCYYGDHKAVDASVTELNQNARICFSLERLQRIPRVSLGKHIVSLWVHELAHMEGYGESQAKMLEGLAVLAYEKYQLATAELVIDFIDLNRALIELDQVLTQIEQNLSELRETSDVGYLQSSESRHLYYNLTKAYDYIESYIGGSTSFYYEEPFLTHLMFTEDERHRGAFTRIRHALVEARDRFDATFHITGVSSFPENLSYADALDVVVRLQSQMAELYFEFVRTASITLCGKDPSLLEENTDRRKEFICSKYK